MRRTCGAVRVGGAHALRCCMRHDDPSRWLSVQWSPEVDRPPGSNICTLRGRRGSVLTWERKFYENFLQKILPGNWAVDYDQNGNQEPHTDCCLEPTTGRVEWPSGRFFWPLRPLGSSGMTVAVAGIRRLTRGDGSFLKRAGLPFLQGYENSSSNHYRVINKNDRSFCAIVPP
jgi:hypothetical protein